jgi:hypothetical protein
MAGVREVRVRRRVITGGSLVVVMVVGVSSMSAFARQTARAANPCRVPRLTGLTLEVARGRAAHAGCALRVKGARLERAREQTIARQSPAAGRHRSKVTVWLNPLCHGSAAYGPGIHEPRVTPGPTELVSGFYLNGGPHTTFSTPHCKRPEPRPGAGTVEVLNASGGVVAAKTSTARHFVEIRLAAGSYTIRGTFLGASINGAHPSKTEWVVIPAGHTVRQDFFLDIK